jgi:tRNA nucleotidyltransferase (CCA-adding enzyme)
MADYIYLLEHRLSAGQRNALKLVREIAKAKSVTVFLVGGAVRDLTSGSPVRDLDVVVQGNALKLKKDMEKAGAVVTGELEAGQALFLRFPGNVRMERGSTLSVTFPKPGKPVMKPATILEDLRRRDFTANAMAISLNDGSYGLLMDPLNGVADIENRELRLVSNYGFIEDPVRMVRAARLMARLGWALDEKTQTRYQTGVDEGYISALSEFQRGYETEEIVHEEDPLRVLKRLEADGWMKHLAPYWTSAKVNTAELERLRDVQTQLQMQGLHPEAAAANFPLLTAKLSAKEVGELKKGFPRQGFVAEIDALEGEAKEFAGLLSGKGAAAASDAWKLLMSAKPEAVLWTAYSSKSAPVQAKLKSFYTEWPQARTKIPYTTLQEMRITPEIAGYDDLLEKLFFALMDGKLGTTEEMKAFLEPFSPPAPPPPVSMRRPRAAKKEAKSAKGRAKKAKAEDEDLDPEVMDEIEAALPEDDDDEAEAAEVEIDLDDEADDEKDEAEDMPAPKAKAAAVKAPAKASAAPTKAAGSATVSAPAPGAKSAPVKAAPVKAAAKAAAVKAVAKKAAAAAPAPAKKSVPVAAKKVVAPVKKAVPAAAKKTAPAAVKKTAAKAPVKAVVKKVAAKAAPAVAKKAAPAKAAAKKVAKRR